MQDKFNDFGKFDKDSELDLFDKNSEKYLELFKKKQQGNKLYNKMKKKKIEKIYQV